MDDLNLTTHDILIAYDYEGDALCVEQGDDFLWVVVESIPEPHRTKVQQYYSQGMSIIKGIQEIIDSVDTSKLKEVPAGHRS